MNRMQKSTQDISQHVYSIEDTEILLLSEELKWTKPEYNLTHHYWYAHRSITTDSSHTPPIHSTAEVTTSRPADPAIYKQEYRYTAREMILGDPT